MLAQNAEKLTHTRAGRSNSFQVGLIPVSENEPALFEVDVEGGRPQDAPVEPNIQSEQIQEIRTAFDRAGITEQEERRALIESIVFREVGSLRELRAVEARRIIIRIRQRAAARPKSTGSAWDTREEDTWIDRL